MKDHKSLIGLIASVCIVVLVAVLIGVFAGSEKSSSPTTFLHTQTARSVEITPAGGDRYTMTLKGVSPAVTRFTNRPARSATSLDIVEFVANWKALFGDVPPNAAIVFAHPNEAGKDTAVVTLDDPSYDGNSGTLTYGVTEIKADDSSGWKDTPLAQLPPESDTVSLFIDETPDLGGSPIIIDPQIDSISPNPAKASGKHEITIKGSGFNPIEKPIFKNMNTGLEIRLAGGGDWNRALALIPDWNTIKTELSPDKWSVYPSFKYFELRVTNYYENHMVRRSNIVQLMIVQ